MVGHGEVRAVCVVVDTKEQDGGEDMRTFGRVLLIETAMGPSRISADSL
jgi:hypothetical protein